jgi:DNA-binding CsgD family transcriptional regulator
MPTSISGPTLPVAACPVSQSQIGLVEQLYWDTHHTKNAGSLHKIIRLINRFYCHFEQLAPKAFRRPDQVQKSKEEITRTGNDHKFDHPSQALVSLMKTSIDETSAGGDPVEGFGSATTATLWFESDPVAQFILDPNGKVLEQNPAAASLIEADLALGLKEGQLVSNSDTQALALPSASHMKARENNYLLLLDGGPIGTRLLLSMRLFGEQLPDGPYYALSAHKTADYVAPEKLVVALDDAFLTPAEFQVALALFQAPNSEEISDFLGISIHTVNTHLKRIFRKVRVNSKQDLILHVLRRLVPV